NMSSWVLYLSAALPLLLGFMGVLIALREDWAKKHRRLVIGAFAVVSILGFYVAVRQIRESIKAEEAANRRADEANEKLHDSMDRLGKQGGDLNSKTDEIRRVESLNTELQNKLLGQSGEIIDSSW